MGYRRYVAIGDSTTEGIDDPDGAGGYRGWADRLAEHLAAAQGSVEYANLAVRGRTSRAIREEQLAPALALEPDVATVVAGVNDLFRRSSTPAAVAADIEAMQRALVDAGAVVVTFTMPDLSPIVPLARVIRGKLEAINDGIRRASGRSGARLLDLAAHPISTDPRLWSDDRLHANTRGHERISRALAATLDLDGFDDWADPLPPATRARMRAAAAAELAWWRGHFTPWVVRHLRGRSSGDGVTAKLPTPVTVTAPR
ncbi:MAG: SGNH/GDSL hydrolase family protein [Actinobacteria bacterium]|nr:SGNH/GDSL hydrolase family protein [Actinomycetota bacterium]